MKVLRNQKVIVRSHGAGVFFGTLSDYDVKNGIVELTNCRRLWYWSGAASLSQLATEGVKNPENCKFTVVVPDIQITQVLEIIPCSKQAITIIERVKAWKI